MLLTALPCVALATASAASAPGAEPAPTPTTEAAPVSPADEVELEARQHMRTGTIELAAGGGSIVAGVLVLLAGRGKGGELSDEPLFVADLRSTGGALLGIGGLTFTLVGFNQMSRARQVREAGVIERVTLDVGPWVGPVDAGLMVAGAF